MMAGMDIMLAKLDVRKDRPFIKRFSIKEEWFDRNNDDSCHPNGSNGEGDNMFKHARGTDHSSYINSTRSSFDSLGYHLQKLLSVLHLVQFRKK